MKWDPSLIAYTGFVVGILRLIQYYFLGDVHLGYSLALAVNALVGSVLYLLLAQRM